ncbi:uncharacterized protein VP01_6665g1, partial [Puccinia sorghi]
ALQSESKEETLGDVDYYCRLLKVECFSSDLSAVQRKRILEKFRAEDINILICSDMIARGMDIMGVDNVVNYDAPIDIKKYVHRVGRTARANSDGKAFSLVEAQEAKFVKNFLKVGLGQLGPLQQLVKIRIGWRDLQALSPYYHVHFILPFAVAVALKKLAEMFGCSVEL